MTPAKAVPVPVQAAISPSAPAIPQPIEAVPLPAIEEAVRPQADSIEETQSARGATQGADDVAAGSGSSSAAAGLSGQAPVVPDAESPGVCAICQFDLKGEGGPCESLACGHVFHTECITNVANHRRQPRHLILCPLGANQGPSPTTTRRRRSQQPPCRLTD